MNCVLVLKITFEADFLLLILKRLWLFFSKNTPKLPFLAHEAQMNFLKFFVLSIVGFFPRLLGEHVQKVS
jgi:hypothetical protein